MRKTTHYDKVGVKTDKVRSIYPTWSGGVRKSYATRGDAPDEDREPRAIACFQCGQPIEDFGSITECPFCESDNFLGKLYE